MKVIAIFTGYFSPHLGGVEKYVEKLSYHLSAKKYKVIIITSNHDNLLYIEERKNLKIYRLPVLNLFRNRYPIPKINCNYIKIIKEIKNQKIDYLLLNTRFHLISLIGAKIGKKLKKPILLIEHGSNHFTVNNKILDFCGHLYEHILTNVLKKYVDKYYGVSLGCNEWLKHFKIEADGVFYNSIEKEDYEKYKKKFFIKKKKNEIIITFAGRLIKEKGIFILLDAFNSLSRKYPQLKLIIAGEGPLFSKLKSTNKIWFTGKLTHEKIMTLFNSSDIFVHPSMFPEGLPTSILEAGLMKCAIIATDRGGTIEVINNNDLGLIIKENSVDLEEKIEHLVQNPKLLIMLKENISRHIINNFTWDKVTNKIIEEMKGFDINER